MKKNVLIFVSVVMLMLTASLARAYTCTVATSSTVLTPPSVTVPRDLPVGSPIGSELVSGTVQTFNCSNTSPALTYQEFGVKGYGTYVTTINGRRIYSTNVAGIGYAVGATSVNNCTNTAYVDGLYNLDGNANNRNMCNALTGIFSNQPITAQARIQFYKTAQTTGTGTVSARNVGGFILRNNQASWVQPESVISIAAFNVKTLACTVSNTVISVPMGTVEKRAFSGVGTWPGDANTRSFTVPLNCNAGTRVNVQIDGSAQNASQGVLNLTGGTVNASGVGIQLLYNSNPLPLATPVSIGTASSEGAYNIPLQARYYQTDSDIVPGSANASATFTLTYQ